MKFMKLAQGSVSQKSYDHTCNNTLARIRNVIANAMPTMRFLTDIIFILKALKSHFKRSYDKQNLTHAQGSFHKFHIKWSLV